MSKTSKKADDDGPAVKVGVEYRHHQAFAKFFLDDMIATAERFLWFPASVTGWRREALAEFGQKVIEEAEARGRIELAQRRQLQGK